MHVEGRISPPYHFNSKLAINACSPERIMQSSFAISTEPSLHHHAGVRSDTLESVSRRSRSIRGFSKLTGQSSAASFATGPVIAEPFISPLGLTICSL